MNKMVVLDSLSFQKHNTQSSVIRVAPNTDNTKKKTAKISWKVLSTGEEGSSYDLTWTVIDMYIN